MIILVRKPWSLPQSQSQRTYSGQQHFGSRFNSSIKPGKEYLRPFRRLADHFRDSCLIFSLVSKICGSFLAQGACQVRDITRSLHIYRFLKPYDFLIVSFILVFSPSTLPLEYAFFGLEPVQDKWLVSSNSFGYFLHGFQL